MQRGFSNSEGKRIVEAMIEIIHENRAFLSEIDGAIADGDHGINMDKGFTLVEREIADMELSMSDALKTLGRTLVMEIGGSMGPLYGSMFKRMARASKGADTIDTSVLATMLSDALDAVVEIGGAKVGDKTMIDTLEAAARSAVSSRDAGMELPDAIDAMIEAAEAGYQSTKGMVAKVGRSSRLGERSLGVVDAGAASCYLLLKSMGETMRELCL